RPLSHRAAYTQAGGASWTVTTRVHEYTSTRIHEYEIARRVMETALQGLEYRHVDVFTREALSGNGVIVFPEADGLTPEMMQRITQEMRQFESIFLAPTTEIHHVGARGFTMEEERPVAGHAELGAAWVLHE